MTAVERDRRRGGEREEGGFEGSALTFPGMQPRDRLLQRRSRKAERLFLGRQTRCILPLAVLPPPSSSGPGYLGPREGGGGGVG